MRRDYINGDFPHSAGPSLRKLSRHFDGKSGNGISGIECQKVKLPTADLKGSWFSTRLRGVFTAFFPSKNPGSVNYRVSREMFGNKVKGKLVLTINENMCAFGKLYGAIILTRASKLFPLLSNAKKEWTEKDLMVIRKSYLRVSFNQFFLASKNNGNNSDARIRIITPDILIYKLTFWGRMTL